MSGNGKDAADRANPFGDGDSSEATNSDPEIEAGDEGVDAHSQITGLTEPTFRPGNPDGDVTMRDNPTNVSQDAVTHETIEDRARADEARRAAAEASRARAAAEQAAAALLQQQHVQHHQQIGPQLPPLLGADQQRAEEAALRAAERRGAPKTPQFAQWNPKTNSEEKSPPRLEGKF